MAERSPERVVLLIDLNPLLSLASSEPYLSVILSGAHRILSSPELAGTLAAHRFFFSSLSPVLSTSLLHRILPSSTSSFLSFNHADAAFSSLSASIYHLRSSAAAANAEENSVDQSRAQLLSASLLSLLHDYAWDSREITGRRNCFGSRSNLVLLFSPVSQFLNSSPEFLGLDKSADLSLCLKMFKEILCPVKDGFLARDIHLGWVNVNHDFSRCGDEKSEDGFVAKGIKESGWDLCSTDAIVFGSSLVPFGLILPYVGCGAALKSTSGNKKCRMSLFLKIADVKGEQLECKLCDLDSTELLPPGEGFGELLHFSEDDYDSVLKIHVEEVWKANDILDCHVKARSQFLLRAKPGEIKEAPWNSSGEFFADKVLKLLCREDGGCVAKGKPIWQLLLVYLYRRQYFAKVSISNGRGGSFKGIIKPVTVNCGLLCTVGNDFVDLWQLTLREGSSCPSKDNGNGRKRSRMDKVHLQEFTWISFCNAVFNQYDPGFHLQLEEVYFSLECGKSKKLRFLRCWMKQIEKVSCLQHFQINDDDDHFERLNKREDEAAGSDQRPEQHFLPTPDVAVTCDNGSSNEEPGICGLEDVEAFFQSIPEKIKKSLCSQVVDTGLLAERLVCMCIDALLMKQARKSVKDIISTDNKDDPFVAILDEVSQLLLMKPKDLAFKYKDSNSSNNGTATCKMDNKVQEHELQILLRMEILRSKIGGRILAGIKRKMIKEICSLLRNIEFNLEVDLFHGESLVDFADRTIKLRYAGSLQDVIHAIYRQMEFFSFDGDDFGVSGSSTHSNNDDSQEGENDKVGACLATAESNFASSTQRTGVFPLMPKNGSENWDDKYENVHKQQVVEAQEKRSRDRRFSSFTSWMPDLQRRWILKQIKIDKPKSQSSLKLSKKIKRRNSEKDMVRETPMSGMETLHNNQDDQDSINKVPRWSELNSCRSLSKVLFDNNGTDLGSGSVS